ncbi:MAG: kinase, partial [Methanothermobacter sp.]|nr:kinase [Methanothermobacter sp.]
AHVRAINRMGGGMIDRLLERPAPARFMALSREFAEGAALIPQELREPLEELSEGTLGASMAMLGNTVFALSEDPDAGGAGTSTYGIDQLGARFI